MPLGSSRSIGRLEESSGFCRLGGCCRQDGRTLLCTMGVALHILLIACLSYALRLCSELTDAWTELTCKL